MANVLSNMFTDIAGAIREKTGDTATMKPAEFAEKIRTIPSDGEGIDPYYGEVTKGLLVRNAEYISGNSKVIKLRYFRFADGELLGNINPYSFAGFENVEAISLSGLMIVSGENVFYGCSNLQILDFTITNDFGMGIYSQALNTCTALSHIIFRGNSNFNSININSSQGSVGNFYIYVPRANYNNVIANLSNLSGAIKDTSRFRILEDYPEIDNWEANYT